MPSKYKVQVLTITGSEIERVQSRSNFAWIKIVLSESSASPNDLEVAEVYAADDEDNKLIPDDDVNYTTGKLLPVNIKQAWIDAPLRISKAMILDVSSKLSPKKRIESMVFYNPNVFADPSSGNDYIGYKVRISHK